MATLSYYDTVILALGSLFLGIIMLIRGGNWTVDSAVYIANKYGISPMVIGFTIIAFGTSLPELVVSVVANIQGSPGIAIGNVLGSNIANVLMVLGFSALFVPLAAAMSKPLLRDVLFMVAVTVMLAGLLSFGTISRVAGFAMLLLLAVYVFIQYKMSKDSEFNVPPEGELLFESTLYAGFMLVIGLVCIAIGAEFLVKGARVSAELIGVPDAVIALSLIAFGTSLPELSTSIIAAKKNQSSMVIGNIIGSNVFNILMIMGVASLVKPILIGTYPVQLASFDIWVTLSVAIVFSIVLFVFGKIGRVTGGVFFLCYILYNVYIYNMNMVS